MYVCMYALTNVTQMNKAVLTDVHAGCLLRQLYFHTHWTIFYTEHSLCYKHDSYLMLRK